MPTGKVLPLDGVETTAAEPQPLVAMAEKNTGTPFVSVVVTVILAGLVNINCGSRFTMIEKLAVFVWPQVSNAVTLTTLVPTGKVLPLGGVEMTVGELQPPVAVAEKETVMPLETGAEVVMLEGQLSTNGEF